MKDEILLVDDEAGICKVLGISLKDRGYRVYTAESGENALDIFAEKRPAIVITDIKMPGMDGIGLLKRIKHLNADTEVIMITGHGDMDLAIESLKHNASDFITKPIGETALDVALKRVSDRIAMRRRLAAYTEDLENLVREKSRQLIAAERMAAMGETVAGLSHTIKSIASGLRGGSFVLEKGIELKDSAYLEEGWAMVRSNVEKITQLSLDLLDYGKFAGVRCRPVDPNRPLREVFDLLAPVARHQGVALDLSTVPDPQPVDLDPEAMHRCLLNLVDNAIAACSTEPQPAEPRRVRLASRCPDGWGVEYTIRDNGIGMDDAVRQQLFKGFFTTKGSRGTGIGLMMSQKIVDLHRGRMDMESLPERGTTFRIRLPRRADPSPDAAP